MNVITFGQVKKTEAVYRVRDPTEVMTFLTSLVKWGQGPENAWHRAQSCSGWRLNPQALHLDPPQPEGSGYDSVTSGEPIVDGHSLAFQSAPPRPPFIPSLISDTRRRKQ